MTYRCRTAGKNRLAAGELRKEQYRVRRTVAQTLDAIIMFQYGSCSASTIFNLLANPGLGNVLTSLTKTIRAKKGRLRIIPIF